MSIHSTTINNMSVRFGIYLAVLIFGCSFIAGINADTLPALHQIQQHSFSAPYSCGGSYNKSALFLSPFALKRNTPDLLYNGACNSDLFFQSNTAGDDFALITLIGSVSLENVDATMVFQGANNQHSTFQQNQQAIPSMTYAALLSKSDIRALFAFKVKTIDNQTKACDIEYVVLSYAIQDTLAESPGFDWSGKNTFSQSPSAAEVEVTVSVDPTISMTIMGATMGAAILGLIVAVIVLGVKLQRRSGYSHIQH
eukprot:TRINITY_DN3072_c0_g1_i1.p1 TRINITY_DN3072_c0_g1~~TRINITY_DN3072_c0_g1_i1.p1  ORF type:complete len:254 (-),score=31.69 TRINITY_DN3072_c0_g1_i1:9-770(-)